MQQKSQSHSRRGSLVVSLIVLVLLAVAALNRQAIYDWSRLRNYQAPTEIAKLADETAMTDKSRNIFYVNHPQVAAKETFNQSCPNNGGEQTIVLGCYRPPQQGIYVFKVTDAQLTGVEQVTAAHEMLHAAYDRLSSKEKEHINMLLNDYSNQTQDQRLKDVINSYRKTEPNDVVNEMHSIFGTEVATLPAELEEYYKQYFTDRQKVVAFAAQYQGAFTSRRNQITQYDAQLLGLKKDIDAKRAELDVQASKLQGLRVQLDALRGSDTTAYNAQVDSFNAQVATYNQLRSQTQSLISQYNSTVEKRNAIALEEQNLAQALDSRLQSQSTQH